MLKWILIALGILLWLVALPAIVGFFIPRAHVARSSITLNQPPDSVWQVIRDFGNYHRWWPNV